MDIHITSSACKMLAEANKDSRYGIAHLPGQGVVAFQAVWVGNQHLTVQPPVAMLGSRLLRVYDTDGSTPCKSVHGKTLVIVGYPGQKNQWGNQAVCNGQHAAFVYYSGRPKYVFDSEQRESVRQHGRDLDNYVEAASYETADYWKYLARDGTSSDLIFTKEEIRKQYKDPANDEFFRILDKDKSSSFEVDELRYAGME